MSIRYENQLIYSAGSDSGGNDTIWNAQTFKAISNHNITSIIVKIKRLNSPSSTYIDLLATSAGVPTGSALATSDAVDGNSLPTSMTDTTFTFSTPYTVTSGTTYAFRVRSTGATGNNIYTGGDTSDDYADGQAYVTNNSGGSYTSKVDNPYDFYFDIYGDSNVAVNGNFLQFF